MLHILWSEYIYIFMYLHVILVSVDLCLCSCWCPCCVQTHTHTQTQTCSSVSIFSTHLLSCCDSWLHAKRETFCKLLEYRTIYKYMVNTTCAFNARWCSFNRDTICVLGRVFVRRPRTVYRFVIYTSLCAGVRSCLSVCFGKLRRNFRQSAFVRSTSRTCSVRDVHCSERMLLTHLKKMSHSSVWAHVNVHTTLTL